METPRMKQGILFETAGTFYNYTHYVQTSFLFNVERVWRNIEIELVYTPLYCHEGTTEMKEMMREALKEQIYRTDEPFVEQTIAKAFPIKNEISVAVKGPDKWIGEHHSFPSAEPGGDSIVIGEDASDGMFKLYNTAGSYEVILHVFGIYTPECNYKLTVRGLE